MRILVTGASGFVGSHLCRELEEHGHRVTRSDIEDADLSVPGVAERLLDDPVDQVVHLAARYGRILCRDEPHRAVTDNAAATTELAAACAASHTPVLYASSSEVYGDHGEDWITEGSELRMPTTIYGLSKRWGEEALNLYLGDNVCHVRMNMVYGPQQRAGYGCCALATFIKNALAGEPINVHAGTSRSWMYVSDTVAALRLLIEGHFRGVFNLGNEFEQHPMIEVAEMVADVVPTQINVTEPPHHQVKHKKYDSAKLRRATGWLPDVELAEGIRRTVASQRKESLV